MFQKGCQVVYGIHGICNILDTEIRMVNRNKVEYYVLQPLEQPAARYYVPTQNQSAVAKLSPLLTKEDIEKLLCSREALSQPWIHDENQRKLYYRSLICSGDRTALIGMIRLLHEHKSAQLAAGRKFHLSDENFLADAQKLLCVEISLVLGISREEAEQYIQNALNELQ